MIDERALLERALKQFPPESGIVERVHRRRERKRRNERVAAAALALVLAAAAVGSALAVFRSEGRRVPAAPTLMPANVGDMRTAWSAQVGMSIDGVAVGGGEVFAVSDDGSASWKVAAFDESCGTGGATCRPLWTADVAGPVDAPSVSGGVVYVPGDDLTAFPVRCGTDGGTCDPLWIAKVEPGAALHPVVAGGHVFVTAADSPKAGRVFSFAIDCATGGAICTPTWTSALLPHPMVLGSVSGDVVYAGVWPASNRISGMNTVYAFPADCSGTPCNPSWVGRIPGQTYASPPVVIGDTMFVGTGVNAVKGTLRAYDAACGVEPRCEPRWVLPVNDGLNLPEPVVADGRVFIYSRFSGRLSAFPVAGSSAPQPFWTGCCPMPVDDEPPVLVGGLVFLGSTGGVVAFPEDCVADGAYCRPIPVSPSIRDVIGPTQMGNVQVADGMVFASSTSGRLYALAPRYRPPGTPAVRSTLIFYGLLAAAAGALILRRFRFRITDRRWGSLRRRSVSS